MLGTRVMRLLTGSSRESWNQMPTYQYRCTECRNDLEAFQKFTDDPLTICPNCGGALRKVFGRVGVVFKGSGFYSTDSRKSSAASNAPATTPAVKASPAPAAKDAA